MTDYPDFTQFAYIDIIAQTLGRILNRPTYGGALASAVLLGADPGAQTVLFDVTGEGMIYGGYLMVNGLDTCKNDRWLFYIDGNLQNALTFDALADFYFNQPYGTSPICTCRDEIDHKYGLLLPYGITFETGFELRYQETSGRSPPLTSGVSYTLV